MLLAHAELLVKASRKHPDAALALRAWVQVIEEVEWHSITDVRQTYPGADGVQVDSGGIVTVFNIRGNRYRLLAWVSYRAQVITIIALLTHAEYDKGQWRRRL